MSLRLPTIEEGTVLWGFALFFWLFGVVVMMFCGGLKLLTENALAIGGVTTALGAVWSVFLQMSLREKELGLKQKELDLEREKFEFEKSRALQEPKE